MMFMYHNNILTLMYCYDTIINTLLWFLFCKPNQTVTFPQPPTTMRLLLLPWRQRSGPPPTATMSYIWANGQIDLYGCLRACWHHDKEKHPSFLFMHKKERKIQKETHWALLLPRLKKGKCQHWWWWSHENFFIIIKIIAVTTAITSMKAQRSTSWLFASACPREWDGVESCQ